MPARACFAMGSSHTHLVLIMKGPHTAFHCVCLHVWAVGRVAACWASAEGFLFFTMCTCVVRYADAYARLRRRLALPVSLGEASGAPRSSAAEQPVDPDLDGMGGGTPPAKHMRRATERGDPWYLEAPPVCCASCGHLSRANIL